jgi:manganese/iron transport system ATP-binding protein
MAILKDLKKPTLTGHYAPHEADLPIVEAVAVNVGYETGLALEDISFRLKAGERVAVVGPNGAGKSTLFKAIAGLINPSSGEVRISGNAPGGHICIAYLPQRSQVDWTFPVPVADVVMMGRIDKIGLLRWPKKSDWAFVHSSLKDVGLADLADRRINELSGGQQQRMFIARALAQESELMLMDEPLSGLDVTSQEIIFSLLDALRKRGVTVMISTHDLDQAAERFDRVMLLNHRLLGFGPPEAVFNPQNLLEAYGGHLRLVQNGDQLLALGDSCCDDGEGQ